jgi:phenylpyruvate tautomerase
MPYLKVHSTVNLPEDDLEKWLEDLSREVAGALGKPERVMMVSFEETPIAMGGSCEDAAWIELRAIGGLSPEINGRLTQLLCSMLEDCLSIPPDRVYIHFIDVAAQNWGWDGKTFAE